jgi:thiol:disulfide interchange protein/DsbC/DsbD-like thiol-disulfide interchange protein
MLRFGSRFLTLLAAGFLAAAPVLRASDAIPDEPTTGRSATVTQPHVTAELIAETITAHGGHPFQIALHLHMDPGWHTYWINPGDAGLATDIKWTLPPGWSAGPIEWPTPEAHMMGPLTTYGYAGDVYLLTTITPPKLDINGEVPQIKARATWLVCQEECIPGKADLTVGVSWDASNGTSDSVHQAFFTAARARLPVENGRWTIGAAYQIVALNNGAPNALVIHFKERGSPTPLGHLEFYPDQPNVLSAKNAITSPPLPSEAPEFDLVYSLQQNGEKPDTLSGVLVSDVPLIDRATAINLGPFSTHANVAPVPSASVTSPSATVTSISGSPSPAVTPAPVTLLVPTPPFLPAILAAAFLGGLILNLMPCVLPVLSLKVFSLIRHAGDHAGGAWKQGLAFAAGVLVSFWILAGLLIALESAGQHLGWGFQMQSPGFVLALVFLFFLLGLNLFGVFELGTSLVGLDAKATTGLGGLASSFANGALATLAATPCTAPFMGSAVGFAAQQPAAISLLVFTALALGMAAPYLALTTFPGAMRLVPKPGAWMETLKQFMGFLLMGTVIFLVYVFGALTGEDSVPMLLGALLVAAVAAWILGRGTGPTRSHGARVAAALLALCLFAAAVGEGVRLARQTPLTQDSWQPWSPSAVHQALAQGHPVFVDFTAAWCLSCKVNERLALDIDSTKKLFAAKRVALFRGDWTHSDPQISDTLRQFNRNGVPLYLVYSPQKPDAPQVLPEVLTPGLVQDALQKLP